MMMISIACVAICSASKKRSKPSSDSKSPGYYNYFETLKKSQSNYKDSQKVLKACLSNYDKFTQREMIGLDATRQQYPWIGVCRVTRHSWEDELIVKKQHFEDFCAGKCDIRMLNIRANQPCKAKISKMWSMKGIESDMNISLFTGALVPMHYRDMQKWAKKYSNKTKYGSHIYTTDWHPDNKSLHFVKRAEIKNKFNYENPQPIKVMTVRAGTLEVRLDRAKVEMVFYAEYRSELSAYYIHFPDASEAMHLAKIAGDSNETCRVRDILERNKLLEDTHLKMKAEAEKAGKELGYSELWDTVACKNAWTTSPGNQVN